MVVGNCVRYGTGIDAQVPSAERRSLQETFLLELW